MVTMKMTMMNMMIKMMRRMLMLIMMNMMIMIMMIMMVTMTTMLMTTQQGATDKRTADNSFINLPLQAETRGTLEAHCPTSEQRTTTESHLEDSQRGFYTLAQTLPLHNRCKRFASLRG